MDFDHSTDLQWPVKNPFLICGHQKNAYPPGNTELGPAASLEGRSLGNDFSGKDGWSMYHGQSVPGFPAHPHRGFETITILSRGYIDHSDSLGARARFAEGDVQWLAAGSGIAYCEMFPLLHRESENPFEMFQIWLNLPAVTNMPHHTFRCCGKRAFRDSRTRVSMLPLLRELWVS